MHEYSQKHLKSKEHWPKRTGNASSVIRTYRAWKQTEQTQLHTGLPSVPKSTCLTGRILPMSCGRGNKSGCTHRHEYVKNPGSSCYSCESLSICSDVRPSTSAPSGKIAYDVTRTSDLSIAILVGWSTLWRPLLYPRQ